MSNSTESPNGFGNKMKKMFLDDVFLVTMFAIILGLLVGAVALLLAGYNPIQAYGALIRGVFGKPKYIGWTLVKATPLILTGLSVAFAFRTGLFNIGAEGQFMIGALAAALVGYFVHAPAIIHIPLIIIAGAVAAGFWGGIAGYFKAKFGVNEVISTIMLNWIALYLNNFMVDIEVFKRYGTEASKDIQDTAKITFDWLSGIVGNSLKSNYGLVISIAIVIIVYYYLYKTVQGYELRAVGFNKNAAEFGGINVNKAMLKSMSIAGALAGIAGALQVSGVSYHVSKLAVSEGYGFNGIAVALIGNNTPIGSIFGALLFGGLQYGGTKMQAPPMKVPPEVISVVIGSIIFFIAISNAFRFILKFKEKKAVKEVA